MADGTLAIKHVGEPAVTPPSAMSPLRNLSRPLQSTASSVIVSLFQASEILIVFIFWEAGNLAYLSCKEVVLSF